MALRGVRVLINGDRLNKLLQRPSHAAAVKTQIANLRSAVGYKDKIEREKGFDYDLKPYGLMESAVDSTYKRMNENSKVIVVDGNIATNKTEFAKQVAKEFDLKYIPEPTEEEIFFCPSYNADARSFNEILPENLKIIDLPTFYKSKNPEKLGIARTQTGCYLISRVYQYCQALNHVLNTGQGVVVDRGPYSGSVYAEVLYKMGYTSKQAFKYHKEVQEFVESFLWRPHVYIYLGAPAPYIKEQIKKRAITYEVKTKVLTDDYIKLIDSIYRKTFLPSISPYAEVLVYDAHEIPEWDVVVGDLEKLNLDPPLTNEPIKFIDWDNDFEPTWNSQRFLMSKNRDYFMFSYTNNIVPPKCWEYEDIYKQTFAIESYFRQMEEESVQRINYSD